MGAVRTLGKIEVCVVNVYCRRIVVVLNERRNVVTLTVAVIVCLALSDQFAVSGACSKYPRRLARHPANEGREASSALDPPL
ncbi:unnamed protein product [Angiostrongylus costaricensis]|uniref:Secreted protein n=1 Tax=Angiostrongylus costaricensis TaxID=334426 RepID=A0A0R3PWL1_ANGCS|nr:unnamed protein product [Angiostrongylus costaricensis]